MNAKLISPNGKTKEIQPRDGKTFKLDELQEYVDGPIQIIDLFDGSVMVVNEEGKIDRNKLSMYYNRVASELYNNSNDFIVGPVVVCPADLIE
jgi:uncharacterized protein DUF3846